MSSIVWGRDPQEAYENPYEYEAQEQFSREADAVLSDFSVRLDYYTLQYGHEEQSLDKASWMLAIDLVDSLHECTRLIQERRHRVAARLFRDVLESIDLLRVLHAKTPLASAVLEKWYSNETIPHRQSRQVLSEIEGTAVAAQRKIFYDQLSKFTHRTYRALSDSYSLGRDNLLIHDSHSMGLLVLPQTIASYLAVLADLIVQASDCLSECCVLSKEEVQYSWSTSLESHTVPRRFAWVGQREP